MTSAFRIGTSIAFSMPNHVPVTAPQMMVAMERTNNILETKKASDFCAAGYRQLLGF